MSAAGPLDSWLHRFMRLMPDADAQVLATRFFAVGAQVWAGDGRPPHPLMILLVAMGEITDQWEAQSRSALKEKR